MIDGNSVENPNASPLDSDLESPSGRDGQDTRRGSQIIMERSTCYSGHKRLAIASEWPTTAGRLVFRFAKAECALVR
jgi:hypothetical protein